MKRLQLANYRATHFGYKRAYVAFAAKAKPVFEGD